MFIVNATLENNYLDSSNYPVNELEESQLIVADSLEELEQKMKGYANGREIFCSEYSYTEVNFSPVYEVLREVRPESDTGFYHRKRKELEELKEQKRLAALERKVKDKESAEKREKTLYLKLKKKYEEC